MSGSRILDAELLWLFTEAAGELGLHGTPLEPTTRGGKHEGISGRQLAAAARHRRIVSALHGLPRSMQRTLRRAHTPLPPGERVRLAQLGDLAAVVVDLVEPLWLVTAIDLAKRTGKKSVVGRDIAHAFLAEATRSAAEEVRLAVAAFRGARAADDRCRAAGIGDRRRARSEALYGRFLEMV